MAEDAHAARGISVEREPAIPVISHRTFFYRTLIVIGTAVGVAAAWRLSGVLLLIFAAVLVALILASLSMMIERRTGLAYGWSLALSILLTALAMGASVYFFGTEVAVQVELLSDLLPAAWDALRTRLQSAELTSTALMQLSSLVPQGQIISTFGSVLTGVSGVVSSFVLVIAGGVYLAAQPNYYIRGVLLLVPHQARPLSAEFIDTVGRALRHWLIGQLLAMLLVGVITGTGLRLLGVPSPLALGLLAGLLEFIPFAGPVLAAVPALLLAAIGGIDILVYTLLLYVLVQQVEGNLIQPLVQRRAVDLPPALTIFSLIALSSLFGPLGLLLAAPLTVVGYVGVKKLYLNEVLNEGTSVPGEKRA